MRIICPNCAAQYEIDAAMIPASGRDVQCSNCSEMWFQSPVGSGAPAAPEERPGRSGDGLSDEAARFFSGETVEEEDDGWLSEPPQDEVSDAADEDEPETVEPETVAERTVEEVFGSHEPAEDDAAGQLPAEPEPAPEPETAPEAESASEPEPASQPEPDSREAPRDERAAEPEPAEEPADEPGGEETGAPEIAARADAPPLAPAPRPAAAEAPHPRLDPSVLGILRAEAEREIAARRAEQSHRMETQVDLGLEDVPPPPDPPSEAEIRTARLRGRDEDPEEDARRRALLPDIDDVNATLTAMRDRDEPLSPAVMLEEMQARRTGFRFGFSAVMLAVAAVILLYVFAPELARGIPSLEPALTDFVDWANSMRLALDDIMARSVDRLMGLSGGSSG